VSAEQVALVPQCAECGAVWLADDLDRWHCYVVDAMRLDALTELHDPEAIELFIY
jgi:hypothetical protein